MGWMTPPPPPPLTVERLEQSVRGMKPPPGWPVEAWVQAAAQSFVDYDGVDAHMADVDGDGAQDLVLASHNRRRNPPGYLLPTVVFRYADLQASRVRAYPLPGQEGGFFRSWGPVGDLNGDGRRELAVEYGFGGSGDIRGWVLYQWDGRAFRRLFEATLNNWRGPTEIWFAKGRIGLTCRPETFFAHHTMPHREHVETWTWWNGRYRFQSHYAPPAPTARQQVAEAERFFRRQDYAAAALLYQRALTLPREPEYEQDRDWAPYIHLRLGQIEQLLGHGEAARRELGRLAEAGGYFGEAAQVLLKEGLLGVMRLPREPEGLPGVAWFTGAALAPPEVVPQAHLAGHGTAEGFPARLTRTVDLDGDGSAEIWLRPEVLDPRGAAYDLLAVRLPQGWRVGRLDTRNWIDPTVQRRGKGSVLRFDQGGQEWAELGWDGKLVHFAYHQTRTTRWTAPLLEPAQDRCLQD
jgi:hypothetical protein